VFADTEDLLAINVEKNSLTEQVDIIGNESVPIQLAHCRRFSGLAISSAEI